MTLAGYFGRPLGSFAELIVFEHHTLSTQHEVESIEYELQFTSRDHAYAFMQRGLVDRHCQGDKCYRIFWEACRTSGEKRVAGCVSPSKIACKGHAPYGCELASIQGVTLDDEYRPPIPGFRAGRIWKVRPPYLALSDYHSTCRRMLRDAAVANSESS